MHFHSSSPHEIVMVMNDTPSDVFNMSREISNDTLSYQLYARMCTRARAIKGPTTLPFRFERYKLPVPKEWWAVIGFSINSEQCSR